MQIELKVDYSPSGRFTLKSRDKKGFFTDYSCTGQLFGESDPALFYRAVAQEIANLSSQGHAVTYSDTSIGLDVAIEAGSETRPLSEQIKRIKIDSLANITVVQGNTPRLILKAADKRDLSKLISKVSDNTLTIGLEPVALGDIHLGSIQILGVSMTSNKKLIDVTLELPELTDIKIKGSCNVTYLDFKLDKVAVEITGSGDVQLQGEANLVDVFVSGSGEVDALSVSSKTARLRLSGSGKIAAMASESVKGLLSGSGKIKIAGNPISKDVKCTGSGKISYI